MAEAAYCYGKDTCRISWKPYLEGSLKYRYPGEFWQTITAQNGGELTFSTEEVTSISQFHSIPNQKYTSVISPDWTGTINTRYADYVWNGVGDFYYWERGVGSVQPNKTVTVTRTPYEERFPGRGSGRFGPAYYLSISGGELNFNDIASQYERPSPGTLIFRRTGNFCAFKVFEGTNQIFERTESQCPEVQIEPCQVESTNNGYQVTINKTKNQVILITNKQYTTGENYTITKADLPSNTLNVYRVTKQPGTDVISYELMRSIESDCADKPPIYQVQCLNNEQCPPNTCAVECGNHICCYDSKGYPVKQISK